MNNRPTNFITTKFSEQSHRRVYPAISDQMDGENGNFKHERSRARWTPSLDKIFADLVVKHIRLGNRPNNVFDKKTWNHIRDEFNKHTDLNFNNNQLRKHLDVLRIRYHNLKSAFVQNDFMMEDSSCNGFDLWEDIGAQPRTETIKVRDCPIYEQLCAIFTDSSADGKYAQSSHYEGSEKNDGNDYAGLASPVVGGLSQCENRNSLLPEKMAKNIVERKRKRQSETQFSSEQSKKNEEINEAMAESLFEMIAASSWRKVSATKKDEKFTITNCIKALDDIEDIDQELYFEALDLFEDLNLRETFLCLKGNQIRLTWLQGKCGRSAIYF